MTRHLMRLIWNRKRQNFLLTVEIFFSFLTLFGVVLFSAQYASNARQPLGFEIERVWDLTVDRKESARDPAVKGRHLETYRQLMMALREMPQIEAVGAAFTGPYANSNWGSGVRLPGGRHVNYGMNRVTDTYADLFHIQIAEGRWFSREDDGATWKPVVINRSAAREIFGDENAVGKIIPEERDPNQPPPPGGEKPEVMRVIGVIEAFRQNGELSTLENYMFSRLTLDGADAEQDLPERVFIRVAPGTTAAFEETLVKRAMAVAGSWSFEVERIEDMRTSKIRQYLAPLLVVATIAVFLLLMVGLGLTGVVWQSVTQRIREFGLRRAKGATIANVRTQVLTEIALMTTLALTVAVALLVQVRLLPLADDLRVISPGVFFFSLAASALAIYALTLACGWQPSRLATRIQPAEALHYE
jgi:putative ABC transport system permease protein